MACCGVLAATPAHIPPVTVREGFAARLRTLSVIAEGRSTKLGSTKSGKSVASEGARAGLHEASSGSAGSGTLLPARLRDSTAKRDPVGARPVT